MKKFLSNIVIFTSLVACTAVSLYMLGSYISEKRIPSADIYVWGDSQFYFGLNIDQLSEQTHKKVLTSVYQGSGIYDFIVFTECVKPQTTCIVAFSECAFFRKPELDYNRVGLSWKALKKLFNLGCPLNEIHNIFTLNNRKVLYQPFENHYLLYPYNPIIGDTNLSAFNHVFLEEASYADWKISAYEYGLNELLKKGCRVLIVRYPYNSELECMASGSINRYKSESLETNLIETYNLEKLNYELVSDSLLFHDLSHLNEIGANHATYQISNALITKNTNMFIQIDVAYND